MANLFVKKGELSVVNGANGGGYLVTGEKQTPVYHAEFVALQQEAHYLVKLAEKVKGVDFSSKKVTTFAEVVESVKKELASKARIYVSAPTEVAQPLTNQLKDEALAWLSFQKEGNKAERVNKLMQKFNVIAEQEEFGLYFSDNQIVKLDGLYSLQQITDAISILEEHLTV
jgi:hypothetical protein